jgi:hypothetical protein
MVQPRTEWPKQSGGTNTRGHFLAPGKQKIRVSYEIKISLKDSCLPKRNNFSFIEDFLQLVEIKHLFRFWR